MTKLKFIWDSAKAEHNFKKHKISFEEARSVFYDDKALEFYDSEHSEEESRFLLLGFSDQFRLLLVVHCYREDESTIRIISARKATKDESKHYKRD